MDSLKYLKECWENRPFDPGEWITNFVERMFAAWQLEHGAKIKLRQELAREIAKQRR